MKKSIRKIKQSPMDGYEAANAMRGLKPGDKNYNSPALASKAYREMERAGWTTDGYNEFGEVVMKPPSDRPK